MINRTETNPRTTLHPALIRQPPATHAMSRQEANPKPSWDFEYEEPAKKAPMSLSRTASSESVADDKMHIRGGDKGGICCGICAGLACFECLECCC
ncbi:hypothetical protein ACMFMG_005714 [Clarireedia jacksonii]